MLYICTAIQPHETFTAPSFTLPLCPFAGLVGLPLCWSGLNFFDMKDPAFLFYSSDFLSGTMFLSDEQVGIYIRLLCAQHQRGRLTEKHMLSICKVYDKDVFEKFTKDAEGNYYNERLELETIKRSKYSESRKINALSPKKPRKAYAKHMGNRNENIDIDKPEIKNMFTPDLSILDEFWKPQIERWIEHRKKKKKPLDTQERVMLQIKKLKELSQGNINTATGIIDQSISEDWVGLFELTNKTNGNTGFKGTGTGDKRISIDAGEYKATDIKHILSKQ
jgi:uncharacterized protein YdaU (DUF1376 family)